MNLSRKIINQSVSIYNRLDKLLNDTFKCGVYDFKMNKQRIVIDIDIFNNSYELIINNKFIVLSIVRQDGMELTKRYNVLNIVIAGGIELKDIWNRLVTYLKEIRLEKRREYRDNETQDTRTN